MQARHLPAIVGQTEGSKAGQTRLGARLLQVTLPKQLETLLDTWLQRNIGQPLTSGTSARS